MDEQSEPQKVAAFVGSVCRDNSKHQTYVTREEAEQLGLDGYKIDTFSSDYADEFGQY
jgi:hypothetical protein